ncbi:MAG TPA: hypothetical protein DIT97_10480 [Gimesia maris]|uniref:DUF416 domain-containing protein n=1 Tax=Gimesia maris TaxID=122 RepID=A0A3D3R5V1_9PLAN|nr:hypothetical protein [Gimesia maris]|tara:strand:- start:18779 stop:19348 length:570 start_codon:yes stop_codon:yes gene_type:complete
MNKLINDMDDHYEFMTKQLRILRHFERCLFAVWCADRLLISHADRLIKNLSQSDLRILQDILNDIWDSLLNGMIPEKDQLNVLDMDFMEVDDGWSDPMRDIDPIISIVQQSIGMCILCCRRNDVGLSQDVAQSVIDGLDCKLEKDDPSYTPATQFNHPQIQHELETQLAMIKNLKGEYELVPNLRTMFR